MTSPGIHPWRSALALFIGCWATAASPCSVSPVLDAPFSPDTYGFYGEVVGHVAMRIPDCEKAREPPDRCAPSWGLRIRILEPLNLPARNLTEVEYFNFGTAADCGAVPVPQAQIQRDYPVGTRIGLAGRLFTWDEPRPPRIRLTSLRPIVGEAIYTLPKDADLRSLAATSLDYAGFIGERELKMPAEDRARLYFELWRDTLRLYAVEQRRRITRDPAAYGDRDARPSGSFPRTSTTRPSNNWSIDSCRRRRCGRSLPAPNRLRQPSAPVSQ